jgi:phosphatidyl-myo-inositol dimannoside synthase
MPGPKPRLLVLTPDYPPKPGGIQLVAHRLVHHFTRVDPLVVTIEDRTVTADERGEVPIREVRAGRTHAASVLRLNVRAIAEGVKYRPAAILNLHIVTAPSMAAVRKVTGAPAVQYLHALEIGARPRLARFGTEHADRTIAVSRHTHALAARVGAPLERVEVIAPGVDVDVRAAPHSKYDRPTVVTVARLQEQYKGHDVMVRALPLVRARVPDVNWAIVGSGPYRHHLENVIASYGVGDCVTFLGGIGDAERDEVLNRSHVFAMPSRLASGGWGGEGFGIAYVEAGLWGLPVVGGNVGGALDAVVDGETGLLVDPTDHVALADALTALLLDPVRARSMGRAGRAHAQQFAWPIIASRVEDLLLELIGCRNGQPSSSSSRSFPRAP